MRHGGRPDDRPFVFFVFRVSGDNDAGGNVCRLSFVTSGSGRWCNSVTPVAPLQRRCAMLDADVVLAPRIEKQNRCFKRYSACRAPDGTARSRKLTVLPMRILRLRLETHLHLTLQRSREHSASRQRV
jgi:hypothetical protein